jgi:hypothetical protein
MCEGNAWNRTLTHTNVGSLLVTHAWKHLEASRFDDPEYKGANFTESLSLIAGGGCRHRSARGKRKAQTAAYEAEAFEDPSWEALDDEEEVSWRGPTHAMPCPLYL